MNNEHEERNTLFASPAQIARGLKKQCAGGAKRRRGDVKETIPDSIPEMSWEARLLADSDCNAKRRSQP